MILFSLLLGVLGLAYVIALIIAMWRIFEKAGRPGWEAIVPIYNGYILITQILKKEWWWLLLCFIPYVGVIPAVILYIALARSFGRDVGIGILCVIGGIGIFILGFGPDKYIGATRDAADDFLSNLGKRPEENQN